MIYTTLTSSPRLPILLPLLLVTSSQISLPTQDRITALLQMWQRPSLPSSYARYKRFDRAAQKRLTEEEEENPLPTTAETAQYLDHIMEYIERA